MRIPIAHARHQGPVVAALGRVVRNALRQFLGQQGHADLPVPGPEFSAIVPARDAAMVADFVRWAGGEAEAWAGRLPPALFPQWGFPVMSRTLDDLPHPLLRILNGGCRLEIHEALPLDTPLHLSACLEELDDDGRRVLLKERLHTGTAPGHRALTSHIYAVVPLGKKGGPKKKKERPTVPDDARRVADLAMGPFDGLAFACLTGDFNPIHWNPPMAWLSGFPNTILHGFGTMARAIEAMTRHEWDGDTQALKIMDVRFTKPLVLPRRVGLFVDGDEIFVADDRGKTPYLMGSFETR